MLAQASCGKVAAAVFGPKTPREQYEQKIAETPEGKRWREAAAMSLQQPVTISLPYRQKGRFPDNSALALGLSFKARKGERLNFGIDKLANPSFALYADLFYQEPGGTPRLLHTADTAVNNFAYDIETEGIYVLRLQPELMQGGLYHLEISSGPSIGFPVTDTRAHIGSFWGADRDGGKRRHEGVDIFAKKGSPAVAAMDGYITAVQETPIGGKVIWLRPEGKEYTLYYAHLDRQDVQAGQQVLRGDQLGTVGNTGNARTTPAHLHFGIYTFQGPVDPLPFVDKKIRKAAAPPDRSLAGMLRLLQPAKKGSTQGIAPTLTPLGVNSKGYLAADASGLVRIEPFAAVKLVPATATNGSLAIAAGRRAPAM